jgi:hypothetical protein
LTTPLVSASASRSMPAATSSTNVKHRSWWPELKASAAADPEIGRCLQHLFRARQLVAPVHRIGRRGAALAQRSAQRPVFRD